MTTHCGTGQTKPNRLVVTFADGKQLTFGDSVTIWLNICHSRLLTWCFQFPASTGRNRDPTSSSWCQTKDRMTQQRRARTESSYKDAPDAKDQKNKHEEKQDADVQMGGAGDRRGGQRRHKPPKNAFEQTGPLLAKATSFLLQSAREVDSILLDMVIVPADHAVATAMKAKTKEWSDQVKEAGKAHALGPPHLSAWVGCLAALEKLDIGAKNKTSLKDMQADLDEMQKTSVPMCVRACRVKQTYDKTKVKIILAVRGDLEKYRPAIVDSFVQVGADYKCGRAPPSAMERAIQDLLSSWAV